MFANLRITAHDGDLGWTLYPINIHACFIDVPEAAWAIATDRLLIARQ